MKKIGIVGGVSWPSTRLYYEEINRHIASQHPPHGARLVIESLDIGEVLDALERDDRPALEHQLGHAAQQLLNAGADLIAIGSSTLHDYAREVRSCSGRRFIPITDALGQALRTQHIGHAGLLATRHTLQCEPYKDQLRRFTGTLLLPDPVAQARLDRIIFEHLIHGHASAEDQRYCRQQIQHLLDAGADAVILGSTDLCTLDLSPLPASTLLDAARIHARYLAELALEGAQGVVAA